MKIAARIFSTFFGAGYFPLAPGTFCSLLMVILYKFYLYKLSWLLYLMILIFGYFTGVYTSSKYSTEINKDDPRVIVIDEALGQLFVLFMLGTEWLLLFLSFAFFRLFDILKPFPIKKIETLPKGWGIMTDDLMAAAYARLIICLWLLLR
ncbi:phosphatidylglycerophosphatase A [Acidobacteriota bacterium]